MIYRLFKQEREKYRSGGERASRWVILNKFIPSILGSGSVVVVVVGVSGSVRAYIIESIN